MWKLFYDFHIHYCLIEYEVQSNQLFVNHFIKILSWNLYHLVVRLDVILVGIALFESGLLSEKKCI